MKRLLSKRPSPALIIAVVALAMAMGGTAYAALVITGKNVKNYSLTGKDIAKDSLGRVPIKEERLDSSKIGKVKQSVAADTFGGLSPKRFEPFNLPTDGTRELLRAGPLVITARCRVDAGKQIAEVIVQTNTNGVAVDGPSPNPNLQTTETAVLANSTATLGTPHFDQEASSMAIAADGTEVFAGDLYTATSVLGQTNQCRFGGLLYVG